MSNPTMALAVKRGRVLDALDKCLSVHPEQAPKLARELGHKLALHLDNFGELDRLLFELSRKAEPGDGKSPGSDDDNGSGATTAAV